MVACEALVNSMSKRVKAALENNGGQTKYDATVRLIEYDLSGTHDPYASSVTTHAVIFALCAYPSLTTQQRIKISVSILSFTSVGRVRERWAGVCGCVCGCVCMCGSE